MRSDRSVRLAVTLTLVAVAAAPAVGARLFAQQQTASLPIPAQAKTGKGRISGVVIDSLNARYLQGADVVIDGASTNLVTDSVGSFRIDSLAPGTYQVGVFHPFFDTLGISLATRPFRVGPDSTSTLVFAVPSAVTLIRRACPPPWLDKGISAVIGHVDDPETLEPIPGAEVSIAWVEYEVSTKIGVHRIPHELRGNTDAAGAFRFCGVPSSMHGTLRAHKGAAVTSEIPITLGDSDSELFARTILLSAADSASTTGNASVSGTVALEGSTMHGGTRVELVGTDVAVMTNDLGQFTMTKLPSGSHLLLARHLGYGAASASVDLSAREPQSVRMTLPRFVAVMDPVLVTARRNATLDRVGFGERRKSASGYFLGPEDIDRMHPVYMTDILRRIPGLRVSYTSAGEVISSARGVSSLFGAACVQYFLDNMPWRSTVGGDLNNFVNANEVVAVEVYQGPNTPGEFVFGEGDCTTVVLWTRFKIRDKVEPNP